MRLFKLWREHDVSGVSGTGWVAEGVEFTDGTVAMRWLSDSPSLVIYSTLADAERVHCHGGHTEVRFEVADERGEF